MIRRVLYSLIPLVCLLVFGFFLYEIRHTSIVFDRGVQLYAYTPFSNAFHTWQLDPVISIVTNLLGMSADTVGLLKTNSFISLLTLLILVSGVGVLLLSEDSCSWKEAFGKTLPLAIILLIFGFNPITYASLCWIPWIFVVLRFSRSIWWKLILGSLFTALAAAASGVLGLFFLPFIFFLEKVEVRSFRSFFVIVSIIGCLAFSLHTGTTEIPNYPSDGHLVTDDGVPGHIRPLTTDAPPIPIINRHLEKRSLGALVTVSLCSLLLLFPLAQNRSLHFGMLIGTLALFLDTVVAEEFSLIAPLQTLRRVIPGGFWVAPAATLFAALLLSLSLFSRSAIATFVSLSVLSWILFFSPHHELGVAGLLLTEEDERVIQLSLSQESEERRDLFLSPSFALIRDYSLHPERVIRPKEIDFTQPNIPLKEVELTLQEGSLGEIGNLSDEDPQTRLRIGSGGQQGGEFLCVELNDKHRAISALSLELGRFPTDFPRGLRLYEGSQCEEIQSNPLRLQEYTPWEGPILFTDKGYPYYGKQSQIELKTRSHPQAVRLEQTEESFFDWSIAELRVFTEAR